MHRSSMLLCAVALLPFVLSSPPVETETARRMLFSAVGACKFEEAWGYYEAANPSTAGRSWDPEGKWQWRVFECLPDRTRLLLGKQKGRPEWFHDKESIVLVGDSLDRMTVERFCAAVGYKRSETPPGLNAIESYQVENLLVAAVRF